MRVARRPCVVSSRTAWPHRREDRPTLVESVNPVGALVLLLAGCVGRRYQLGSERCSRIQWSTSSVLQTLPCARSATGRREVGATGDLIDALPADSAQTDADFMGADEPEPGFSQVSW